MNGARTGFVARVGDALDREIALRRRWRADLHRLVGARDVHRVLVRFRVDGDRLDAHAPRRADHATGDLAAVSDQDLFEHFFEEREEGKGKRDMSPSPRPSPPHAGERGNAALAATLPSSLFPFPSEGNVRVLPPWVLELLLAQHRERPAEPPPRLARHDDIVDEPAVSGDERVGEFLPILLSALRDLLWVAEILAEDDF